MTKFVDLAHVPEDVSEVFDVAGDPLVRIKGSRWSYAYRPGGKPIIPEGVDTTNPMVIELTNEYAPFTLTPPKAK